MTSQLDAYRFHRLHGRTAWRSLALAREDIAKGTARYPAIYQGGKPLPQGYGGSASAAYGESHMRWIEKPAVAGLRFVGDAHAIVDLPHTGWYTDDDCQDEIVKGVVYQMATRNGAPQYVYGYADPWNDGPVYLSFDVTSDKSQAAHWADSMAERMAEQERDYRRAWSAGREYQDAAEDMSSIRQGALALIRELKSMCPNLSGYPATLATIRARIESAKHEMQELRDRRANLLNEYGQQDGFKDA